ncbi:hypothetical protein [Methylobacterium sp. SD21]|uniref:hypothetical protein n=1 Tax=Methylobacterium litchii TaxID=3138810 RepID=UPI00313CA88F
MSGEDKREQQDRRPADVRTGPAAADALRDREPKTARRSPNKMLSGDARRGGYETK